MLTVLPTFPESKIEILNERLAIFSYLLLHQLLVELVTLNANHFNGRHSAK